MSELPRNIRLKIGDTDIYDKCETNGEFNKYMEGALLVYGIMIKECELMKEALDYTNETLLTRNCGHCHCRSKRESVFTKIGDVLKAHETFKKGF